MTWVLPVGRKTNVDGQHQLLQVHGGSPHAAGMLWMIIAGARRLTVDERL